MVSQKYHSGQPIPPTDTEVSKGATIRNRYNQVPHLTQDTNGKVINSQLLTVRHHKREPIGQPFPSSDHKAHINRRAQRHSKHKTDKNIKDPQKKYRLGRSVKYFAGGLKPVSRPHPRP